MNCGYTYIPVNSVSTTLLLLQKFPSLSISYLYVLESKMCFDKVYYGLGTTTVTRMTRGTTNMIVMKVMITPKITIIMTTKTMVWSKVNTRVAMVFLKLGVLQLLKSGTRERRINLKLKEYYRWFCLSLVLGWRQCSS